MIAFLLLPLLLCSCARSSSPQPVTLSVAELIIASHQQHAALPQQPAPQENLPTITVEGAVHQPGTLFISAVEGLSLQQVICQTGGLRWDADRARIEVLRTQQSPPSRYQLSCDIIAALPPSALLLQPGDRVSVHRWPLLDLWGLPALWSSPESTAASLPPDSLGLHH